MESLPTPDLNPTTPNSWGFESVVGEYESAVLEGVHRSAELILRKIKKSGRAVPYSVYIAAMREAGYGNERARDAFLDLGAETTPQLLIDLEHAYLD